jgi:hypothetical protein
MRFSAKKNESGASTDHLLHHKRAMAKTKTTRQRPN